MDIFMVWPRAVGQTGKAWLSSLHRRERENGSSKPFMHSGFSLMPDLPLAASFLTSSAIFMALHTLGARTAWVRFISWSDTAQAGMRLCFTVSKADRTETVRLALSCLIARAIFTARPAWMVTRDALVARSL